MLGFSFVATLFFAALASAAPTAASDKAAVEAAMIADGWTILTKTEVEALRASKVDGLSERSDSLLEKRNIGGVYICTDINWGGTCGYKVQPLTECIVLTSPWDYTISSFGPDMGTACVLFNSGNCNINTHNIPVFYPGNANLVSQQFNDLTGSFKCYGTNRPQDQCMSQTWPGISCTYCCNNCNRSGQDCCPFDAIC